MYYKLETFTSELATKAKTAKNILLELMPQIINSQPSADSDTRWQEAQDLLQECNEMHKTLLQKEEIGEKIPLSIALIEALNQLNNANLLQSLITQPSGQ